MSDPPVLPLVASEQQLAWAPEVGVLAVLDAALLAANTILVAAQGDLEVPIDDESTLARQITDAAGDLRLLLREYRNVVLDLVDDSDEDDVQDGYAD